MTTTTAPELQPLVPLPEGTHISYTFPTEAGPITVIGYKGPAINPGYNAGFKVLDADGDVYALISRHARVTVLS